MDLNDTTTAPTPDPDSSVNETLTLDRLTPDEWDAQVKAGNQRLQDAVNRFTQREWIQIRGALDATRDQIGADSGLLMMSVAWVQRKRESGGASWDEFLNMTDADLMRYHGFPDPSRKPDGR